MNTTGLECLECRNLDAIALMPGPGPGAQPPSNASTGTDSCMVRFMIRPHSLLFHSLHGLRGLVALRWSVTRRWPE